MLAPLLDSQKQDKRIGEILTELGVSHRPMPTPAITKQFRKLKQGVANLLELQKAVVAKEYEIQNLKKQKEQHYESGTMQTDVQ